MLSLGACILLLGSNSVMCTIECEVLQFMFRMANRVCSCAACTGLGFAGQCASCRMACINVRQGMRCPNYRMCGERGFGDRVFAGSDAGVVTYSLSRLHNVWRTGFQRPCFCRW
jgi:hypothetical protein